MPICETCGNDYDKTFDVLMHGEKHVFDSFECAIRSPGQRHAPRRRRGGGGEDVLSDLVHQTGPGTTAVLGFGLSTLFYFNPAAAPFFCPRPRPDRSRPHPAGASLPGSRLAQCQGPVGAPGAPTPRRPAACPHGGCGTAALSAFSSGAPVVDAGGGQLRLVLPEKAGRLGPNVRFRPIADIREIDRPLGST